MSNTKYNHMREGAIITVNSASKLHAVQDLAEALNVLTVEDRIHDTDNYGVDLGKFMMAVANALGSLGCDAECESGGFGRVPTLTVKVPDPKG